MPDVDDTRKFTPYELTHLARLGWPTDPAKLIEYGASPVEYITGKVEFGDRIWQISTDALIPRVETEELVALAKEHCLALLKNHSQTKVNVLEVGTGSGVALLSLIDSLLPHMARVEAVGLDIAAPALRLAAQNEQLLRDTLSPNQRAAWPAVSWFTSDLLTALKQEQTTNKITKFDCVLANLPYIPTHRIAYLDESVRAFEPHVALDGGEDGFRLIERFLRQLPPFLSASSSVFLEVDYTHTAELLQPLAELYTWSTHVDQFHRQRFMVLQLR